MSGASPEEFRRDMIATARADWVPVGRSAMLVVTALVVWASVALAGWALVTFGVSAPHPRSVLAALSLPVAAFFAVWISLIALQGLGVAPILLSWQRSGMVWVGSAGGHLGRRGTRLAVEGRELRYSVDSEIVGHAPLSGAVATVHLSSGGQALTTRFHGGISEAEMESFVAAPALYVSASEC